MADRYRQSAVHWADRSRSAVVVAVAFTLVVVGTEVKFLVRDVAESLSGAINAQVVFELASFGVAGLLMFAVVAKGGRRLAALDLRSDVGRTLGVLVIIAIGSWLWSYQGPAAKLALVKSTQFAFLVLMGLWAFRWLRVEPERAMRFWVAFRRCVWVLTPVLVVLTAVVPSWGADAALATQGGDAAVIGGDPDDVAGGARYSLALMHPIATGRLIGLTFLLLLSALLMSTDPMVRTRRGKLVAVIALGALFALLLATKSRGPLAATVAGALAMTFVARTRSQRAYAFIGLGAGLGVIASGVLGPLWRTVVLRGQSTEALQSLTGRDQIFARAVELFQDQPLAGYGYLSGRHIFIDRIPWAGESHNAIVEIAVSLGLIGLLLYALLFVRVARHALRRSGEASSAGLMASEALPLLAFILVAGVVGEGFAGAVGLDSVILLLAVMLTDLDRWHAVAPRQSGVRRSIAARPPSVEADETAGGRP